MVARDPDPVGTLAGWACLAGIAVVALSVLLRVVLSVADHVIEVLP